MNSSPSPSPRQSRRGTLLCVSLAGNLVMAGALAALYCQPRPVLAPESERLPGQRIEAAFAPVCQSAEAGMQDAAEQVLTKLDTRLNALQAERTQKAQEYRAAALRHRNKPEIARLLYLSALSYSPEKREILAELATWTESLIEKALGTPLPTSSADGPASAALERATARNTMLVAAEDHLAQLAAICETSMATASVADLESLDELNARLQAMQARIAAWQQEMLKPEQDILTEVADAVPDIRDAAQAAALQERLGQVVDSQFEEQKEELLAALARAEACLVPHDKPMMLPEIDAATPWVAWLTHFAERLASPECPAEQKFLDVGAAAGFLDEARQQGNAEVDAALVAVEQAATQLQRQDWKARASRALADLATDQGQEAALRTLPGLLAEVPALGRGDDLQEDIVNINRAMLEHHLGALGKGMPALKQQGESIINQAEAELDEHAASLILQILATRQGQYVQLYMQVLELHERYSGAFGEEKSSLEQGIIGLSKLIGAINERLKAKAIVSTTTQQRWYADWARTKLDTAQGHYNNAYDRRAGITANTWDSDKVQAKLKEAWDELIVIHPNDLSLANPGLKERYDVLKQNIEAHRKPYPWELRYINYKRIEDMKEAPAAGQKQD